MTWEGRRLVSTTKNGALIQYSYDDSGLRLSKQDSNGITRYTYDNGKIVHQYTENNNIISNELFFRYDENGAPLSVSYNGTEYFYVLNLQGDIIAIIDNTGALVVEYTYDSWGYHSSYDISGTMASTLGAVNPLRYRGYYYDTDTGFYLTGTRYYDPEIGRFINVDSVIAGVGGSVQGNNMFTYCFNNPINMFDSTGNWPKWMTDAFNWVNDNIVQPIKNFFSPSKQSNVVNVSSHDANRRPYTGDPESTYTTPNGDSRTYGPDGTPAHDYDHNDHGRPDKHPHDSNGGHNHDWENGVRGPAYSIEWEPIAGVALATICVIGIAVVVANDATVVGIVDDFLLGPLGVGVGKGLILIFNR